MDCVILSLTFTCLTLKSPFKLFQYNSLCCALIRKPKKPIPGNVWNCSIAMAHHLALCTESLSYWWWWLYHHHPPPPPLLRWRDFRKWILTDLEKSCGLKSWLSDRIWVTLPSIVWKLKLFSPGARGLLCVDPETDSQQDLNPSSNSRIKDIYSEKAKGLTLLGNKTLRKWPDWNAAVTIKHYMCCL